MSSEKPNNKPSSNWLALQKKIRKPSTYKGSDKSSVSALAARKRRKLDHPSDVTANSQPPSSPGPADMHAFPRGVPAEGRSSVAEVEAYGREEVKNGESLSHLRRMALGQIEHTGSQKQPGKYLALDCEMVGVGIDGSESVLARVSIVNYHGHILLDSIVRPRERVVDYRTEFSGIRPSDMVHARPFEDVQKEVADLLKDRILVGHAVHNDLKALLLSHPGPQRRDTQVLAHKHQNSRTRRPALRHLVKQELGLTIQGGEHSSVTDARATMAVFRLHRKIWEQNTRPLARARSKSPSSTTPTPTVPRNRSRSTSLAERPEADGSLLGSEDEGDPVAHASHTASPTTTKRTGKKTNPRKSFPGGGRRGVSSGLSTVVKRQGTYEKSGRGQAKATKTQTKDKWWKELGAGSKGSLRMKTG
ncbi:ribonuclease H-like domain-containing protein [Daedaleopsis nitida]|nr:ribonuclease H-like domain-containing protein [Daedaleopsis nitida]